MAGQNHFEINVAQRVETASPYNPKGSYRHLFATASRSAVTMEDARRLLAELVRAFPSPGYRVTCTHWTVEGREVSAP